MDRTVCDEKKAAVAPKREVPYLMIYWIAGTVFLLCIVALIYCLCKKKTEEEPEKKDDDVSFERFMQKNENTPMLMAEAEPGLPSVNIVSSKYDAPTNLDGVDADASSKIIVT